MRCDVDAIDVMSMCSWLDHIDDGSTLATKLLDLISIATGPMAHDLIASIPEIVDERQHAHVVQMLVTRMEEHGREMMVPILDALAELGKGHHVAMP